MWGALLHFLGVDDVSGRAYAFWSGSGSDLSELALLGGLVTIYRKHNCRRRRCWRFGHYDFTDEDTGLSFKLCARCHPAHSGEHLTRRHIARIHQGNRKT